MSKHKTIFMSNNAHYCFLNNATGSSAYISNTGQKAHDIDNSVQTWIHYACAVKISAARKQQLSTNWTKYDSLSAMNTTYKLIQGDQKVSAHLMTTVIVRCTDTF